MESVPWPRGHVIPAGPPPAFGPQALVDALHRLDEPFAVVQTAQGPAVIGGGTATFGAAGPQAGALPLLAWVPALTPDQLGDATFRQELGTRAAYAAGAMANGIASADLVIAMARTGLLGFFGAAGLSTPRIRENLEKIQADVGALPYGFNLIHNPNEPWAEQQTVDLYLEKGVTNVEAAAFLRLTPMVVQYRAAGLEEGPDGRIIAHNHVFAKISREEVAIQFLNPAPEAILKGLVQAGKITEHQAHLASRVPVADYITAEADSGGHTDNQPLPVLLSLILALRDRVCAEHRYERPVLVGAAGGICTPASTAAAFAMGAAYVLTGTVNQACIEAGTSPMVKKMLADASANDVEMAPASDMFEAGVEVQVLKRGTLFAMRGHRLYELYRGHSRWSEIPQDTRKQVETQILRRPFDEVWAECERFFADRDPTQLERAGKDAKHQMALVFRWYLGLSSRWAIAGDETRKMDTQIWCGPAIGAFNDWTRGTFLADPAERRVSVVAANLLTGAAVVTRATWLRHQGVDPGPQAFQWAPRRLS